MNCSLSSVLVPIYLFMILFYDAVISSDYVDDIGTSGTRGSDYTTKLCCAVYTRYIITIALLGFFIKCSLCSWNNIYKFVYLRYV
jgi:hypothetical protein